jgi:helix-turn-helix protein
MSVFIVSGSNAPETTHIVMGQFQNPEGVIVPLNININEIQDPVKKAVYDSFFNFVGSYVSVEIINSPFVGDFNHVTPNSVENDAIVIDYNTLSQSEKEKVDNAFTALYELSIEDPSSQP